MRIQTTEQRKRRWEMLVDATNENTKSGALDAATSFYLQMAGGNVVSGETGAFEELMMAAEERGSLTAPEIAEILDTNELHVQSETSWTVGGEYDSSE